MTPKEVRSRRLALAPFVSGELARELGLAPDVLPRLDNAARSGDTKRNDL
jgi:hypothetical protein